MAGIGAGATRAVLALATWGSLSVVVMPADASAAQPPRSPAAVAALAAAADTQDAVALRDDAVSLRGDVDRMMTGYVDTYRRRFTSAQVAELTGLRRDADRRLATVVDAAGRLSSSITRERTSAQVEAARRSALGAWSRARDAADTSYARARAIMEPRLSLLEKISALGDYTAMMGRFDALGEEIRTVGTARTTARTETSR